MKKFNISAINANERFGIVTAITEDMFYDIRRYLIRKATDKVILVGSSLKEAFGPVTERASILQCIQEKLGKKGEGVKELEIFITEPLVFDEEEPRRQFDDSPIERIGSTLAAIKRMLTNIADDKKINIYFIPLLQMDHLVFVNDLVIIRNTMLWTKEGEYKGTWLICKKTPDDNSMYNAYCRYIDAIKFNSFEIKKEGDYTDKIKEFGGKKLTKAKYMHYNFRTEFFASDKGKKIIRLHKMYRKQLISYTHGTWNGKFASFSAQYHWESDEDAFIKSKHITKREELFNPRHLLNDSTQKILLPYIKKNRGTF